MLGNGTDDRVLLVSDTIRKIVQRFGEDILLDNRRFPSMFKDYAPKLEQEAKIISIALNMDIAKYFVHCPEYERESNIRKSKQAMDGILSDFAIETLIKSLVIALGWKKVALASVFGGSVTKTSNSTSNPRPIASSQAATRYDQNGYDADGYSRTGYDKNGFDRDGYAKTGYDKNGFDRDGYNRFGYDAAGYDRDGYNKDGYDATGYDRNGYDIDGYDATGYEIDCAIEDRHRRFLLGKKAACTIKTEVGIVIVEEGAEITEEVLKKAKLANKFIELSMNVL